MATVRIPSSLRKFTNGREEISLAGGNVGELLAALEQEFPAIRERLFDERGKVLRFINIFANNEDIRFLSNLETPVQDKDEISIIPAIAGG